MTDDVSRRAREVWLNANNAYEDADCAIDAAVAVIEAALKESGLTWSAARLLCDSAAVVERARSLACLRRLFASASADTSHGKAQRAVLCAAINEIDAAAHGEEAK